MIKVFNATDKNYATHGDLILQPSKAVVHKEDNGEFYLDLETPLNEKEYKNTTPEEGQTAEGTSFSITADLTKQYQVQTLKGQTTQTGTPTPSSPIPINITTGRQVVSVCGKNLFGDTLRQGVTNYQTGVYSNSTTRLTSTDWITLPTGTYTINFNATKTNKRVSCTTFDTNDNFYNISGVSGQWKEVPFTFTTPIPIKFKCNVCFNDNSTITTSDISDFQLEKGQATTYEEYKGTDYEINLGKNLFNGTLYNTQVGSNGGITTSTTRVANVDYGGTSTFYLPKGTYTLSIANLDYCTALTKDANNSIIDNYATSWQSLPFTFTLTQGGYVYFTGRKSNNSTISPSDYKPQVEKGNPSSYSPHKTPIELCKIGDYQDYIRKTSGKNLFDKNGSIISGGRLDNVGAIYYQTGYYTSEFIKVSPSTIYSKNSPIQDAYHRVCFYTSADVSGFISDANTNENTFTTPSNAQYLRFCGLETEINNAQLEKGSSSSSYEPYGKDKWYIHKEIGRVVLNGSENWQTRQGGTSYAYMLNNVFDKYRTTGLCNYFRFIEGGASGSQTTECIASANTNGTASIFTNNSSLNTLANFKTWLGTHNLEVYYVLNTPTNTLIEDEELINQLNSIELLEGLNNVSVSSANLPAILQLKYNFTTAYSNVIKYIDYLVPNNILVANTPQGNQAFRITNIEKNRRKIKIRANHVFYDSMNYLIADSYVVDKDCNAALDHLNNATDTLSPFTTISDITNINSFRCVRKSLYEAIKVVLERWGGHLVRNDWTIGIYDEIGQDNGVTIRYGKNLKNISATYDWNEVVTKLLPVGKDGILLNEIDPDASIYVESATQYDIPYTKTVSFEQNDIVEDNYKDEEGTLDEDTYKQALVDDLHSQAMEYITNNYLPKVNYKLSANVEKVSDVGDRVEVIDEKLGINLMTNIISYDYDCILERYTQIEFGNFVPTLSNLMTQISTNTEEQININNQTLQITLNQELTTATDKIWDALGNSYVIYEGDKILVVDTLPKEAATNVIMINNGGIAFSNNGINGTFSSAWTIDNVLNMENINVINLSANLVKGGTLKLGSNLNQNGQLEVYDETNALIAEFNKDGLKMYGADGSYVLMNNDVGFAGYDKNDNKIYWVDKDEFHMKKSVIEEEITLCNKMRYIPITIRDNNNNIINDGIGLVSVMGGE